MNKTLMKLAKNKINIKKAYNRLYPKVKKARFVKLKVKIPESKGMSIFLRLLFVFPISTSVLKLFMKNSKQVISKEVPIPINEVLKYGLYKKMYINVKAVDGTVVVMKTL